MPLRWTVCPVEERKRGKDTSSKFMKILIADDSIVSRHLLEATLRKARVQSGEMIDQGWFDPI